jgi:5-methylcytosine-specific restriction endonuclease McrA
MPYKDIEARRAYGREWMKKNPEKARAGMRRWRRDHPDEHSEDSRTYYARNKDKVAERIARYKDLNPDVKRTCAQNRRARKIAAGGSFTLKEWNDLVASYGGRCAYCGKKGPLTVDHRVPFFRGGTNAISNILPACHLCNFRKHTLSEAEFRARLAAEAAQAAEAAKLEVPPVTAG